MKGNIHLERGEFQEAEPAFRSVMQIDGQNVEGLFGLALAHKGLGRYSEAIKALERCLELEPNMTMAIHELAEVLLVTGKAHQAEQLLLELSPEEQDLKMKLTLANSRLVQGKTREAFLILNDVEKLSTAEEQVLLFLGDLFLEAREEERALAAYRRAVRVASSPGARPVQEEAEVFNVVGHLLARHGDLDSSAMAFRKAVHRDPSFAAGHNNLGIVLARMEHFEEAEAAFLQAIDNHSGFAEAHYNLGNLYLQMGKIERSIQMFRRALSIRPDYARARAKLAKALSLMPPEDC